LRGQVSVLVPPRLVATPVSAVVEEGETVSLACLAHGVPPPTILWSYQAGKNNADPPSSSGVKQDLTFSTKLNLDLSNFKLTN